MKVRIYYHRPPKLKVRFLPRGMGAAVFHACKMSKEHPNNDYAVMYNEWKAVVTDDYDMMDALLDMDFHYYRMYRGGHYIEA